MIKLLCLWRARPISIISTDAASCAFSHGGACSTDTAVLIDVLMDRADRHRALAYGSCDALHRPVAHIAGSEHPRHAGLKRKQRARRCPPVQGNVAARQDEPAAVAPDCVAEPIGAGF